MSHIVIKTPSQIEHMRVAGRLTYQTLELLREHARPGITTKKLDKLAREFMRDNGATPSFLGYMGYPASICASVNDTIIHGIPSGYALKDGDILSVDVGACIEGYHGDAARTFLIGEVDEETKHLVEITERCFTEGIKKAVAGNFVADISREIQAR